MKIKVKNNEVIVTIKNKDGYAVADINDDKYTIISDHFSIVRADKLHIQQVSDEDFETISLASYERLVDGMIDEDFYVKDVTITKDYEIKYDGRKHILLKVRDEFVFVSDEFKHIYNNTQKVYISKNILTLVDDKGIIYIESLWYPEDLINILSKVKKEV